MERGFIIRFDLHVHTNQSDGLLSPEEVVDLAIQKKLDGIAITDHDTISGIAPAINHGRKYGGFTVIPGIEFGCIHDDEEVHILGYFIDIHNKFINKLTARLRESRVKRGIAMTNKLIELGLNISMEDVREFSSDNYIGRPHIARALIKRGYVENVQEAFEKYLGLGKPGYIDRYKLSIEETILAIKNSGGIAVLAHPGILKNRDITYYCIEKGIDGIECIQSKHTDSDIDYFKTIVNDFGLIATGGSDFHGDTNKGNSNAALLGDYFIDINEISAFKERI
ncbi:MAG: PHP domain-containing protein [Tissierellaceae bacterium]|nr:PHP domain-containing protein [Tissierellaceae bacterium]